MDFGAILDKWERQGGGASSQSWGGGPVVIPARARGADAGDRTRRASAQEKRRRLRSKRPDAQIDLHGKTGDEAWVALESFFGDSRDKGLEKVLVIHGKGTHSKGEALLRRVVMSFIERCPFAGESGRGKACSGGEGATWVLLKETVKEGGWSLDPPEPEGSAG